MRDPTRSLPAPKSDFIDFEDDVTHLATGGQPPLFRSQRLAFDEFARDKARGQAGYEHHWEVGRATKALAANLTGIAPADHALVGSASEAIGRVVSSFDWTPGDNVVVADKDYASGRFALLRLAALGVEPRIVPSAGRRIDPQHLVDACDDRTRLLYVSQVTSLTGQHFDIAWLSEQLQRIGVALLVDASHAAGVVPVDGRLADFTVSAGYKFLCATHMGLLAWNRDLQPRFEPMSVGWASAQDAADGRSYTLHPDASRAQSGNPNHLDVYLLRSALTYLLDFGIEAISAHVLSLCDQLHHDMTELGLEMITPADRNERGSSVSFATAANRDIRERAAADKIYVWDGGGRVRASLHLFNTPADVERYTAWLSANVVA